MNRKTINAKLAEEKESKWSRELLQRKKGKAGGVSLQYFNTIVVLRIAH